MRFFGYGLESLAKFCDPKHNIKKGCNTIRFGTLYDFREAEDEKLRDEGEGRFDYTIEFPKPTKVSNAWLNCFEAAGPIELHISEMEFNGSDKIVTKLDLLGSCHNCWIYCISKSTESAGSISDTHQDKWLIPAEKLPELSRYLGSLLWGDIKLSDLPAEIVNQYSIAEIHSRLSLAVEVKDVRYVDRSIKIRNESELPISKINELKDMVAFTKPKSFQFEHEIRIAFWLTFEGKKISIANKPKIVNLRAIDKII